MPSIYTNNKIQPLIDLNLLPTDKRFYLIGPKGPLYVTLRKEGDDFIANHSGTDHKIINESGKYYFMESGGPYYLISYQIPRPSRLGDFIF